MKIRNGFVSNSSSSSFVVIRKDDYSKKNPPLITPEEEKLLADYGFKKVDCCYAEQVPIDLYYVRKPPSKSYLKLLKKMKIKLPKKSKKDPYFNYGYDVTCNEDDVICFLLKNNISFEASCHYSHHHIIYKKGSRYFLKVENFGIQASSSNWRKSYDEMCEWFKDTKPVMKINVKDFLKQQRHLEDIISEI